MQAGKLAVDLSDTLAVVSYLGFDQFRPSLLKQISHFDQHVGTLLGTVFSPGTFGKGAVGGLNRGVGPLRRLFRVRGRPAEPSEITLAPAARVGAATTSCNLRSERAAGT